MINQNELENFMFLGMTERFKYPQFAGNNRAYVGDIPQTALERIAGMDFQAAKLAVTAYRQGWVQGKEVMRYGREAVEQVKERFKEKTRFYFK